MSKLVSPEEFMQILQDKKKTVVSANAKAVAKVCNAIKNEAQKGMTETKVDNSVTYGKHGHHPSLVGEYPAVDTGTLRRSVNYDVSEKNEVTIGRVGSPLKYGSYLEHGTSKMKARKWLRPSLDKCDKIWKREMLGEIEK